MQNPCVLSLAGWDPSCGAGLAADIKTCEAYGVYGLGVCTGVTYQNHETFDGMRWIALEEIKKQIDPVLRYPLGAVKIGIIENTDVLMDVVQHIKTMHPTVFVIWDPVLSATTGHDFHKETWDVRFDRIAGMIDLITPNASELRTLSGESNLEKAGLSLSTKCSVITTSYKQEEESIQDVLFINGEKCDFFGSVIANREKHGSGCVFSTALACSIARGADLQTACTDAGRCVRRFLQSDESMLGWHYGKESGYRGRR
ncbi:MAG: hydroxymethylpyrimidine/phosphomethylpyrimidine kinase [Fibrobacteria bacterium]|nr:hydroxymethylpyrimidine/phosphomethylpyrimidine kinase [Fibrobacteria bacterium]